MARLTDRDRELVAIGASIGSNCVPCIAFHVGKAREAGLTDGEIEGAIAVAEEVRRVPANLVVNTARAHLGGESEQAPRRQGDASGGCCS